MTCELKWLLLCAALALGEACGFALPVPPAAWPAFALLTVLTVLAGFGLGMRAWPFAALFLCGLVLALATAARRQAVLDDLLERHAGEPTVAVLPIGSDIREEPRADGRREVSFAGEIRGIRVRTYLTVAPNEPVPRAGETWEFTGWLARTNDGLFGRRRSFRVSGRRAAARRLASAPGDAHAFRHRVRAHLSRLLGYGLAPEREAADLNRAMLLGERERLSRETRETFIAAGTIHVFAISGLHVLLIARLMTLALQLCGLPFRAVGLALLPLLWSYVWLVGSGPSAVRAAIMASAYSLAPLFWRRPNGFTAWSIAFFATYAVDPSRLMDVGCGLSFAVMFTLVLWDRWREPFAMPTAVNRLTVVLLAWAAGVPLAAHVFGRLTPGGLIANLAVVPLAGCSVLASVLGLAARAVLGEYAGSFCLAHANNFAALSTDLMAALSRLLAASSWSQIAVEPWPIATCIAWYLAFGLALYAIRVRLLNRRTRI